MIKKVALWLAILAFPYCFLSAQSIIKGEYFYDQKVEYGAGIPISVTGGAVASTDLTLDVSGLDPGSHRLFVRYQDSEGKWSQTLNYNIFIKRSPVSTLVHGEYFFDAMVPYGAGMELSLSSPNAQVSEVATQLAVDNLPDGIHRLFFRFQDNKGRWSQTYNHNVFVKHAQVGLIARGEYFIGQVDGFGEGTPIAIDMPGDPVQIATELILSGALPAGDHDFFYRFQDTQGRWSQTYHTIVSATEAIMVTIDEVGDATGGQDNGFIAISVEGGTAPFDFEWTMDGLLVSEAEDPDMLPAGTYDLTVTDVNGCSFMTTVVVEGMVSTLEPSLAERIQVYPNPVQNLLHLKWHFDKKAEATYIFFDSAGNKLEGGVLAQTLVGEIILDVVNYPPGFYVLQIANASETVSKKVVIIR